ncbi:MAG: DoxX family protein [Acidimicrobiia bacterium]|nr:DoxX family protein [Acidimicrobiia bacterium]NNF08796.1 DoxX family protein [Acidimicrobiia bacterium]
MEDAFNSAMLILRLGIGAVFLAHGVKHARSRQKTIGWFESIGFKQAGMQWFVMTATEIGAGALLIAGLLNSLAAGAVVGTMAVAFWTVHRKAGFFITAFMKEGIDVEGWEYVFTLAFAATALAIAGPGEWSIDHQIELATDLDGWVGAAVVAGSLVVSALQLATFYRPTD